MALDKSSKRESKAVDKELLELTKTSHSLIRSTSTFDNGVSGVESSSVSSENSGGFFNKALDLSAGDTFLFKRSFVRKNGEIGHDYTGFSVSSHVLKNYYQDKLREKSSLMISILFLICFALFFYGTAQYGSKPFFWFNRDLATGSFLVDNYLTIFTLLVIPIFISPLRNAVFNLKYNKLDNVLNRWAALAFVIAEKDNSDQAFKDLLIRWDYIDENFVNDKVAESFENYALSLDKDDFIEFARNGITLSVIERDLEKYSDSPAYERLSEEAKENGNAVRKLILESFAKSFETADNQVSSDK